MAHLQSTSIAAASLLTCCSPSSTRHQRGLTEVSSSCVSFSFDRHQQRVPGSKMPAMRAVCVSASLTLNRQMDRELDAIRLWARCPAHAPPPPPPPPLVHTYSSPPPPPLLTSRFPSIHPAIHPYTHPAHPTHPNHGAGFPRTRPTEPYSIPNHSIQLGRRLDQCFTYLGVTLSCECRGGKEARVCQAGTRGKKV